MPESNRAASLEEEEPMQSKNGPPEREKGGRGGKQFLILKSAAQHLHVLGKRRPMLRILGTLHAALSLLEGLDAGPLNAISSRQCLEEHILATARSRHQTGRCTEQSTSMFLQAEGLPFGGERCHVQVVNCLLGMEC